VTLEPGTVVRRRHGLITEAVFGDVVVLDPGTSRYVRLNGTAAALWDAIGASSANVDTLARLPEDRHGAPAERAHADAAAFVEALLARGLVTPDER
jgi:hypothetical protein